MRSFHVSRFVLASALLSCGPTGPDGSGDGPEEGLDKIEHDVEGALGSDKADSLARPTILGDILPEVPQEGMYAPGQRFLAWTFSALARPNVNINAVARSRAGLATLLLWRPACDQPWRTVDRTAADDLNRDLPADGNYLVVVGPRATNARGSLRALLRTAQPAAIQPTNCDGSALPQPVPVPLPAAPTAPVGTLAGAFSVTASGSSSYTVPIELPPGRAGLQPIIALSYDSSGGNGPVGVGFSIVGLSSIARCPKDFTHDRGWLAPMYDHTDAYCLDGQRLLGNGTNAYKTERQTFQRIMSMDGSGWFRVWTRDGRILTYGATHGDQPADDARWFVRTPEGEFRFRAWYLKEVQDRFGNYYTIEYDNRRAMRDGAPSETNELLPRRITYTAHTSGIPATRSVTFSYAPRTGDAFEGLHFGGKITRTQILTDIAVDGPSTLPSGDPDTSNMRRLRAIHLKYEADPATHQLRVRELQECTGADKAEVCKPSTLLKWLDGGGFVDRKPTLPQPSIDGWPASVPGPNPRVGAWKPFINTPIRTVMPIDLDADGRADVVFPYAGTWKVARGLGDGEFSTTLIDTGSSAHMVMPIDYDGDGRTDLLLHDISKRWQVLVSTGAGFRKVDTGIPRPAVFWDTTRPRGVMASEGYVRLLDLGGDGQPTLYSCDPVSGGWTPRLPGVSTAEKCTDQSILLIDHDGDGRQELMVAGATGHYFIQRTGAPALDTGLQRDQLDGSFERDETGRLQRVPSWTMVVDVNGDGLDDILNWQPNAPVERGPGVALWINLGGAAGFRLVDSSLSIGGSGFGWENQLAKTVAIDVDRDGIAELLVPGDRFYRWNGTTLVATEGPFQAPSTAPLLSDIDGDGQVDLLMAEAGAPATLYLRSGARPSLLSEIRAGLVSPLGATAPATVHIDYSHSADSAVYKGVDRGVANACSFGRACMSGGHTLVSKVTRHNGGPFDALNRPLPPSVATHSYRDGRIDRRGRGWLGFAAHTVTDATTLTQTTVTYRPDFDWRYVGMSYIEEAVVPLEGGRQHKSTTTNTLDTTATNLAYVQASVSEDSETDAGIYRTRSVFNHMDAQDCLASTVTTWSDGAALTVERTYFPSSAVEAVPCRLRTETRTSTAQVRGQVESLQQRVEVTAYEPATIPTQRETTLPRIMVRDPQGDATTKRTTRHQRDAFGNITQTTEADEASNLRISFVKLDGHGLFPVQSTSSLGHVTELRHDAATGALLVQQDPNYVSKRWAFDGFGRLGLEVRPDGSKTRTTLSSVVDPNLPGIASLVEVVGADESQHAGTTRTRHDALGRPIVVTSIGLAGRLSTIASAYDSRGNLEHETRPLFVSGWDDMPPPEAKATVNVHDNLGRPTLTTRADGTSARFEPVGAKLTATDARGNKSRTERDPRGHVISSVSGVGSADESGATYVYGPFDSLRFASDAAGNAVGMTFDAWGRRTQLDDPDRAIHNFTYDAFDQLALDSWSEDSTSAANTAVKTIALEHDALGRLTSRSDPDGVTRWFWDTAANGIGAIGSTLSPSGHRVRYKYDPLGRLGYLTTDVAGSGSYGVIHTYDAFSRVLDLEYPQTLGARFGVHHVYEPGSGVLQRLESASFSSVGGGKIYWAADETDASGHILGEHFGSGAVTTRSFNDVDELSSISTVRSGQSVQDLEYHHDPNGNVRWRRDGALEETFEYDALDRLRFAHPPSSTGQPALETALDPIGNIRSKGDVGDYRYQAPRPGGGIRPHAVSSAGAISFKYDANGNQRRRYTGEDDLTIQHTAFNKPKGYLRGGKAVAEVQYDADGQRVARETTEGARRTRTVYVAGLYERTVALEPALTDSHRYYLQAGGRAIAQVLRTSTRPADRVSYLHGDNLGSIGAVTDEETTPVIERPSAPPIAGPSHRRFDAWGRDQVAWSDAHVPLESRLVHRGFTGHEDDVEGLVNMGGRIYDPWLARFLEEDPAIQGTDGQGLNRYSYVQNNPLSRTDPTGYFIDSSTEKWLGSSNMNQWIGAVPDIGRLEFARGLSTFDSMVRATVAKLEWQAQLVKWIQDGYYVQPTGKLSAWVGGIWQSSTGTRGPMQLTCGGFCLCDGPECQGTGGYGAESEVQLHGGGEGSGMIPAAHWHGREWIGYGPAGLLGAGVGGVVAAEGLATLAAGPALKALALDAILTLAPLAHFVTRVGLADQGYLSGAAPATGQAAATTFSSAAKLADHFARHGPEWRGAITTAAEYVMRARNLLAARSENRSTDSYERTATSYATIQP